MTSQARRATRRWPSGLRCSRSGLHSRGSSSTRMDQRSTRWQSRLVGDRAQVHVVGGRLAADQPDQRERARVEPGEHHDLGCRPPRRSATAASNASASASGSARGRSRSLPPAAMLTRSGAMAMASGHLVGGDLRDHLAAHREVRVAQCRAGRRRAARRTCRRRPAPRCTPAPVTGPVGVRIPEAFGKTVPQRDEGADFRHRVPHSLTCSRCPACPRGSLTAKKANQTPLGGPDPGPPSGGTSARDQPGAPGVIVNGYRCAKLGDRVVP